MSDGDSRRGLRAMAKLFAEARIEEVASMTEPELDDLLRSQGLDPDETPDLAELLPPPPAKPTPVVPLRPRPRWGVWLVAATFAAMGVAAVIAMQSNPEVAENDAGRAPETPRPPAALAKAAALRAEAERACAQGLWGACEERLDEAKAIDPEGEIDDRVRNWRTAIAGSHLKLRPGPTVPPDWAAKPDQMPKPRKP
jgi:hypothetical protein